MGRESCSKLDGDGGQCILAHSKLKGNHSAFARERKLWGHGELADRYRRAGKMLAEEGPSYIQEQRIFLTEIADMTGEANEKRRGTA